MKFYTIFFAILCNTHAVNTIYSEDIAQDAQIKFEINIHPKQKKKKERSSMLLPCVYIGTAFVVVLMGKKGWSYYTNHTQNAAAPNLAPDLEPPAEPLAPPVNSAIFPNSDPNIQSVSEKPEKPAEVPQPPIEAPVSLTTLSLLSHEQENQSDAKHTIKKNVNSTSLQMLSDLRQFALERKQRQEEQRKKQKLREKNIKIISASSSSQSSFFIRTLWKDMASSISTSQALSDCTDNKAQPHCLDNNDSDDETDEEENFSSLQPKVATNPLGKIVKEARKRHNYSSDSIENLIELWRKDNDISHLKRILEQDPSCLLIAVAKKDCDLIKGFLKAGAQAEKLGQEWRQDMNQLLLQNAVKCCKDSKIDKAQQVEALRTIITLDPQYLCTAVRNHKKDEDNSFIEALIASNANVHCNLKNKTPLDIAVMEGHYTCIQPLLAAKAQMTRGKHPIVWWIDNITEAKRKITIAKDTNIFINIFTQNELNSTMILSTGNTFLHHAASKGASAILLALLDYKADPHLVNHSGKTPRAFAYTIQSDVPGKDECIKILEKAMGFREKDN